MKINDVYMDNRVQLDLTISEPMYLSGLFDLTYVLSLELEKLLDEEKRRFGIMLSYLDSMFDAYTKVAGQTPDEYYEVYGKILYLLKPCLIKEYRILGKRKLSRADSLVVIIKRILDFITTGHESWEHYREARTVNKIITKIYDNIRNSGKKSKLNQFLRFIQKYYDLGMIGKYSLDHFSIQEEEDKYKKVEMPGGNSVKVSEEVEKVKEVEW